VSPPDDLARIRRALERAGDLARRFAPGDVAVRYKPGDSPVTDADVAVDDLLRRELPADDEGWLSEETADDPARLGRRRVWVVDPIDGTREFLEGIPEWCVSIGLVEDGVAVAGGIFAPALGEMLLGAVGAGVTLNGAPVAPSRRRRLAGALVVVSRWAARKRSFAGAPYRVRAVGPIAYSLGLVASGRADAKWSRGGKPEWDIAAGVALVAAGGGYAAAWDGTPPRFNRWPPSVPGIVVCGAELHREVRRHLATA
jgi:myo-inositol-1(or 4)-monophosphatase